MSTLGTLIEDCLDTWKERWFMPEEDYTQEFKNYLDNTTKEIKIVTGELNPSFYEKGDIIKGFEHVLYRDAIVRIAFSRKVSARDPSASNRNNEEKELSAISDLLFSFNRQLSDLKKAYPHLLHIYWAKERSEIHYATSDDRHIFLEEPHAPFALRGALFKYDTEILAKEWGQHFDKLIKGYQEIELF